MKIDTKKLNISKKQLVAIAAIAVTGVVLGTAIRYYHQILDHGHK